MEGKMKAAVMLGIGKMGFETRDIPKPAPHQVLVKLEYVGICGSDLHYYEQGAIGNAIVKPPFVLGHEPGGTIVEVGDQVKDLKVGDRVALEPGIPCGKCDMCRKGLYNLCDDVVFYATPPVDGVFCEYVAHDAAFCFKLPDNVSTLEGALMEPLAVGLHAVKQGEAKPGQTAVVFGSGCIGLCTMLALKIFGVNNIYLVDVVDSRLNKAMELGATGTINGMKEDTVAKILEITGGKGADIVLETAGTEITTRQAVDSTKRGGMIVLVGHSAHGHMDVNTYGIIHNELTVKSVFRYRHCYPLAIEAVAAGKVNLKDVATDIFELDDIQEAMDRSIHDKQNIIKSVVKIG